MVARGERTVAAPSASLKGTRRESTAIAITSALTHVRYSAGCSAEIDPKRSSSKVRCGDSRLYAAFALHDQNSRLASRMRNVLASDIGKEHVADP
jgi:hypothetical protein